MRLKIPPSTMCLSDAILLGAVDSVPYAGSYASDNNKRCALGMGAHAIGIHDYDMDRYIFVNAWPMLEQFVKLPCGCHMLEYPGDLLMGIAHLFDYHIMEAYPGQGARPAKWTLEQLVDWVRSLEPPLDPPEPEPEQPEVPILVEQTLSK